MAKAVAKLSALIDTRVIYCARLRAIRTETSGPTITASTAVMADTRANVLCITSTMQILWDVAYFGRPYFMRTFSS